MKQVLQDLRSRRIEVEEVPPPQCQSGGILVKTAASLVSAGTERAIISLGAKSLLGKAVDRPDLVARFYRRFRTAGARDALAALRARLDTAIALGYSASGTVIEVGDRVDEFAPGDRVACGGAGHSSHAEINWVPKNLCAKIPVGVDFDQAATASMGAIAMQAVRVADAKVGERIAVIGLGLIGQLVVQILHAAGCVVWALDIDSERIRLARESGADLACECSTVHSSSGGEWVAQGRGADAVILTASTRSSAPIELASRLARDRGVVVIVGDVRAEIPREPYYGKELQVRYSRSLGPGRYDSVYEELGIDYPYGYVRWTEKRNLEAYLELLAAGKVRVRPLITHRYAIDDARKAYALLAEVRKQKPLGILFSYPGAPDTSSRIVLPQHASAMARTSFENALARYPHPLPFSRSREGADRAAVGGGRVSGSPENMTIKDYTGHHPRNPAGSTAVHIGWIGAGSFSRAKLLPILRRMKGIERVGVANRTGISAKKAARDFGFCYAATDAEEILTDPAVDAIFIATRHHLHAPLARAALERGKHVFVEKPLCVNESELNALAEVYAKSSAILTVGFNRRFSPFAACCARLFEARREPLTIIYRISAAPLPRTHWTFQPEQGHGPIVGEMCHFVDLAMFLTGSLPQHVQAWPISRSPGIEHAGIEARVELSDSSCASFHYVLSGDQNVPKERIEVFGDGCAAICDDFRGFALYRDGHRKSKRALWQDKGHRNALHAFIEAVAYGREAPIPFQDLYAATLATFRIREALACGKRKAVITRQ